MYGDAGILRRIAPIGILVALTAMLPLAAKAAPFFAVTPMGKKCLYFDVLQCR
jgi:hypothetical protein